MMAERVQLRRTKGWRIPPNTVKVSRPSRWGNPFTVGCDPSQFSAALPSECNTVAEAVECYRYFAETWITLTRGEWLNGLKGKNLACWCNLGEPCHADVLLALANPTPAESERQQGDE